MAGVFKSKTSQAEESIKQLEQGDVIVELSSPEEEYQIAYKKRRKLVAWGIVGLMILELVVAESFLYKFSDNDLYNRVLREYEIRRFGQIQLTEGIYEGATDFGYFMGKGKFSYTSGTEYNGYWNNNQLNGDGTLKVPIEGTYQGAFNNSQKSGQGIFTWDDGTVYEGEWKEDQMWGQGKYTTTDGVVYSGTFQKNLFYEGSCTFRNNTGSYNLTYKDGVIDNAIIDYLDGSIYTGTCDATSLSGTGTMKFISGDIYTGSFNDGYRSGQGVYEWISGDKYDGDWSADKMSGTGVYTYSDGSYASGTFESNSFTNGSYHIENDFGTYTFTITNGEPTAVEMALVSGTTYSGAMSNGELSGQAQIKYSNGDQYSGNVSSGQKSGQGTYTWTSGASYEGKWAEDQMNGTGTYFYPSNEDGYKLAGTFENGKPSGECEYYTNSTTHYKTDWSNGKCVKIYE